MLVVATVAGLAWLFLHQRTAEQVVVLEPRSAPVLAAEVVAPTMDAPREAPAAVSAPHDGEQFMSEFRRCGVATRREGAPESRWLGGLRHEEVAQADAA